MLFSFQHSSGLYEQFPRPLRTPHAAQLPAIAMRCDVFGTSQPYPQKPQLRQPYTSPGSSPKHLHPRSHRTSVPCPSDATKARRCWGWEDTDDVRISTFGKWQPQIIWEGNSPFWSGVSKFQLDNKLSINHNSFSEVSSAVASKEDVSPLQARISLTSVQHPHIHVKSGSLLTSKSSNTPRRV